MFSENYFSKYFIGNDSKVDTPVPIPNTEVKHFNAEDSVSENRKLPIFFCTNLYDYLYLRYCFNTFFCLF